jgi:acetyltransferase-like isoleucine patch superfamily enzyme
MLKAIATGDLEAYGIYSGNPAEKIKNRMIEV